MCKDIHYLYILKPVDDPALIRSVLSANSTYEKENEPENVLSIGDGEEGWYTEESAERFRRILAGEHYGVLCVDISIDEIRNTIYSDIMKNINIIIIMSLFFVAVIAAWIRNNITSPIRKLEESLLETIRSGFERSYAQKDLDPWKNHV